MKRSTIKVTLLALMLGIGLSAPLSSFASSHDNAWKHRGKQVRCEMNDRWQDKFFGKFDQENHKIIRTLQRLINRENRIPCTTQSDIVDVLVSNGNFTTLTAAVTAADLVGTLKSEGKFTVFAPTDQAFEKLPPGTVAALLNDIPTLTAILKYHVVSGEVPATVASTLTSAPTVNGQNIAISVRDGKLFINESQVILYDIMTTNGVIHVIDTVLLPQ
ncbi:MAG: fasciclin domain-containing protein [Minisyncoccia bacterium]